MRCSCQAYMQSEGYAYTANTLPYLVCSLPSLHLVYEDTRDYGYVQYTLLTLIPSFSYSQ